MRIHVMAEEPMEWESADREHLGGFESFAVSSVYLIGGIIALLLWMFLSLVVGVGWIMSILVVVPIVILAVVLSVIVKNLIW